MKTLHAGLLALGLTLGGALGGLSSACTLQSSATQLEVELPETRVHVPMDHSSGHVVVDVYLGDKGPYLFQVDTYASIDACLDDDLAEELGFPVVGTTLNSDGRNTSTRNLVSIPELRLGDAVFKNARTLVDDYDWIGTRNGRKVDGLLGFTLFRELVLGFDYPESRLVLSKGSVTEKSSYSLPFKAPSGSPDIVVEVEGLSLEVGIDTGFGGTLALHTSDAEDLPLDAKLKVVGQSRSAYSTYDIYGARLTKPVTLAAHALNRMNVTFMEGSARRLLGYGILKDFVVSFDQRTRRVSFVPPDSENG